MNLIRALALSALLGLSCSQPVAPTPTPAPPAQPTTTAAAPPAPGPTVSPTLAPPTSTPTPRPPATPTVTPTLGPPQLDVRPLVTGLDTPWALDFAPDGRIFLTERPGRVRVVRNGQLEPEPWITLPVVEAEESGLMGLAVDPQFAQNGYVYVVYTYRAGRGALQNRLVRLREDPATGRGAEDRVLFDPVVGGPFHDGGRLKFGPDGKLYWTAGEGGNPALAQDRAALGGKILRLNPDGTVPADNPFPGSPVYSYGHRNPQGLAWQPGTGRLYATEHGPSAGQGCCRDELNLIEPGQNYGWPVITGDQTAPGMVAPVLQSGTSETWAPAGATFVTRGRWAGSLLFTGLRGQALYRVVLDPADPRRVASFEPLLVREFGRLRDVVEGPDGALYLLTSNRDGRGTPRPGDDRVLVLTVR